MSQRFARAVHRTDEIGRVGRRLPHRREHLARLRAHQLHIEAPTSADLGDAPDDECLHALAHRQVARERVVHGHAGRALHPLEGGAHLPGRHHAHVGRLGEIHPKRLGDRDREGGVTPGIGEVGDEQPVAGGDGAGLDQRRLPAPLGAEAE